MLDRRWPTSWLAIHKAGCLPSLVLLYLALWVRRNKNVKFRAFIL